MLPRPRLPVKLELCTQLSSPTAQDGMPHFRGRSVASPERTRLRCFGFSSSKTGFSAVRKSGKCVSRFGK